MRFLLITALLPLTASFASTPYKGLEGSDFILAETTRAVPEGLVLIRDTYQFENAEHPMIGWTPDSPGPHKLIVVLSGLDASDETVFANNAAFADAGPWRAFVPRRRAMEKAVATQGHGMVVVETPDYQN
tara:strand:+ start:96 stop:485 length:390 start_codon:yes stop_codon:yes gene_type:complete